MAGKARFLDCPRRQSPLTAKTQEADKGKAKDIAFLGHARWEGHTRNLKGTKQGMDLLHEEASDGRCMEWGSWEAE